MPTPEANLVKLSQWDALILESLKTQESSADKLLQRVQAGQLPIDDSKFQFDYTRLTELASEDLATFEHAVRHGYQIKYNTLRGIASWILVVFGQETELQLEPGHEAVVASLTAEQHKRLTAVLSHGWVVRGEQAATPDASTTTYVIEPLVRG
ncbi:hypothetical protein [Paenibacillus sp. Soil750]|uniref:hypothetical protein n=1 Tax=Paenibacillus sp. Soil750 TaxID=1736398 RepID=UPI0006FF3989|nr:hypothetical protein [Paenibacillus sp. Soil750]KRE58257.1 hypothetical protein ASL11_28220 [Paenibacillus sp. Soil750]